MLPEAKRLFLIVRGPAPSCDVVGVIPLRGHKGANTVNFAGRAEGRNLRPGSYLLSLSFVRRPSADAPTTFVKVVSKRRSVPAKAGARRPTCSEAQALAAAGPSSGLLLGEEHEPARPAVPPSTRRDGDASAKPASSDQRDNVLGAAIPRFGSGPATDGVGSLITIVILTLIGGILLTMVALVTRFLRGSWNP